MSLETELRVNIIVFNLRYYVRLYTFSNDRFDIFVFLLYFIFRPINIFIWSIIWKLRYLYQQCHSVGLKIVRWSGSEKILRIYLYITNILQFKSFSQKSSVNTANGRCVYDGLPHTADETRTQNHVVSEVQTMKCNLDNSPAWIHVILKRTEWRDSKVINTFLINRNTSLTVFITCCPKSG